MTIQELLKLLGGPVGAFAAAWLGAHLGFRKTRKERALDRTVEWHEKTIQALARYEEQLERVRGHIMNELVIQRGARGDTERDPLPDKVKVPQTLWQDLREAEAPARAALRLADMFTDLPIQVECSTALTSTVNVVFGQWIDLSPEPELPWTSLSNRSIWVGMLRRKLQGSLKNALELDGFWATQFPTFARLFLRYRIRREQKRLARRAAEYVAAAEKGA
jgi:hypothetical protein